MTPRAKTVSVVAVLALLLAAGLWLLNRPHPAAPKNYPAQSAGATAPTPAVAEPATTIAASPAGATAPVAVAQSPSPAAPPAQHASAFQFSVPTAASATPSPSPLTFTPTSRTQQAREVAATARMYAAHAPLRTPEVADPDSKANKRILSTMVAKALAQPATPPPGQRDQRTEGD